MFVIHGLRLLSPRDEFRKPVCTNRPRFARLARGVAGAVPFAGSAGQVGGRPVVFLDGPGGTQVPRQRHGSDDGLSLARDNANTRRGVRHERAHGRGRRRRPRAEMARIPQRRPAGGNRLWPEHARASWFSLGHALRAHLAGRATRSLSPRSTMTRTSPPGNRRREDAGATVRTWEFRHAKTFSSLRLEDLDGVAQRTQTRLVALDTRLQHHRLHPRRGRGDPAGARQGTGARWCSSTPCIIPRTTGRGRAGAGLRFPRRVRRINFVVRTSASFTGNTSTSTTVAKPTKSERIVRQRPAGQSGKPGTQSFESIAGLRAPVLDTYAGLDSSGGIGRPVPPGDGSRAELRNTSLVTARLSKGHATVPGLNVCTA